MYQVLGQDAFLLEAMSTSYVSRAVMDRLKETTPEYRGPASRPARPQPRFRPQTFRGQADQSFRRPAASAELAGYRPDRRPVQFRPFQPGLFHPGLPALPRQSRRSPPGPYKALWQQRGFGYKSGDIAGVTAVSIPVDLALAKIKERAISIFGLSFFALSLLYVGICFFFNRVVIHSLRDLLEIFRHGLRDQKELELLTEAKAKDEIGELTAAAQVMVGHLHDTRQQLEEYTENLEDMVGQRTKALEASQRQLQEKIAARNQELHTLNTIAELITRAVNLTDILPRVLLQTFKLIPARGAALYLLRENPTRLELQYQENAGHLLPCMTVDPDQYQTSQAEDVTDLPSSLRQAASGHMNFFACAEVQNCSQCPPGLPAPGAGRHDLLQVDFNEITPERQELLNSIGQQIGITIESLQNVEQLVRNKDLLQSVFDGITDMMVLLDRDGRIKMVNQAYLRHYGVALEDILDQPCGVPAAGHHCPFSPGSLETVFQTKKPMTEEIQSSQGEIFLVHYYPIVDERGEVVSIVRNAKDITQKARGATHPTCGKIGLPGAAGRRHRP